MKVLHVPYGYFPDPAGGTEVYARALAACQRKLGVTPFVAAPAAENATYSDDGVPVYRYRTSKPLDLRDQYGEGDPGAAAEFDVVLEQVQPAIVHLHAFTSGVSLRVARAAKRRGMRVVFTYHTPTVSCYRGTLLEWGADICDGVMEVRRCARCVLHANGMPKAASWVVGSMPVWMGGAICEGGLTGSAWTALKMTELGRLRISAVRAMFAEVDRIVAVCGWVKELLVRNGVPQEKITLCRQGLANGVAEAGSGGPEPAVQERDDTGLRIAFFGRLDPTKGIDTLIEAMRLEPDLAATLDLFAVAQGAESERLKATLTAKIGDDSRIRFQTPVRPGEVVERLRGYHALAIPSRCLETGPLVAYDAFAAGTPVVGSNLGGIAEVVEHEKNGLLVETNAPLAWAQAFRRLAENRELLARLKRGIGIVRTMDDAAAEMQPVYQAALCAPRVKLTA